MTRQASIADYGLVGVVGGGAAMLLLAMLTIGISALSGSVPLVLALLLGMATVVTIVSAALLIWARRSNED